MQIVSDAYKNSMKLPFRNRAYVKGTIGILNNEAQRDLLVDNAYLEAWGQQELQQEDVRRKKLYATQEKDFVKLDRSFSFIDSSSSKNRTGLVTKITNRTIEFFSLSLEEYSFKGITIDFGDKYPTHFKLLVNGADELEFNNDSPVFSCENVFESVSSIKVTDTSLEHARMRIYEIYFGMVDAFTSEDVLEFSSSEEVSPISETIPNMDVTLKLSNLDGLYSPDNDNSAMQFLELGQKVTYAFGYDVTGNDDIEWLKPTKVYLKSWSATDTEAQFICSDLFDSVLDETYYGGKWNGNGVTLYALAEDVFRTASITDYVIDPYLKKVTTKNPIPAVKISEALQLIANAGRCVLRNDRSGKIFIQPSFEPNITASTNTYLSARDASLVLENSEETIVYAMRCKDFSRTDGSLRFTDANNDISNVCVSAIPQGTNGTFASGKEPKLTLTFNYAIVTYGFKVNFFNRPPKEFKVDAYDGGVLVESLTCTPRELEYYNEHTFREADKFVFTITKGYENSRTVITHVSFNNVTDYDLSDRHDLLSEPIVSRTDRVRTITVPHTVYKTTTKEEEIGTLEVVAGEGEGTRGMIFILYHSDPVSHITKAELSDGNTIYTDSSSIRIIESTAHMTAVRIAINKGTKVKITVYGNLLSYKEYPNIKKYDKKGNDVTWENPLIDNSVTAKEVGDWLATHYLGKIDYELDWRGDPRTDAQDLFYFTRSDGKQIKIRAYQNDLDFNGGFTGKLKARVVE